MAICFVFILRGFSFSLNVSLFLRLHEKRSHVTKGDPYSKHLKLKVM